MESIAPHKILSGPKLYELCADHPAFLAEEFELGPGMSVKRRDVCPQDVANLYSLIVRLGAEHNEATEAFHGIGLRQ